MAAHITTRPPGRHSAGLCKCVSLVVASAWAGRPDGRQEAPRAYPRGRLAQARAQADQGPTAQGFGRASGRRAGGGGRAVGARGRRTMRAAGAWESGGGIRAGGPGGQGAGRAGANRKTPWAAPRTAWAATRRWPHGRGSADAMANYADPIGGWANLLLSGARRSSCCCRRAPSSSSKDDPHATRTVRRDVFSDWALGPLGGLPWGRSGPLCALFWGSLGLLGASLGPLWASSGPHSASNLFNALCRK